MTSFYIINSFIIRHHHHYLQYHNYHYYFHHHYHHYHYLHHYFHVESSFVVPKQLEYTHIHSYILPYSRDAGEVFKRFSLPPNQSLQQPTDTTIIDNLEDLVTMSETITTNADNKIIAFDCECSSESYLGALMYVCMYVMLMKRVL